MRVEHFTSCEKALQVFDDFNPDIVFINIAMNNRKVNGFNFTEIIRVKSSVPILATTSPDDDLHLNKIFDIPNSDFIRKPYGVNELKLRLNKMLYSTVTPHMPGCVYKLGNISFIPYNQTVETCDSSFHLSEFETEVLAVLCKNTPQFVPREAIILSVWHVNDCKMKEPSYYNIITKLRKILSIDPCIKIESKMRSMVRIVIE